MCLIHTKPDACFAVSALSQFMSEPRHRHWVAAKHVLRYLRGSVAFGLRYTSSGGVLLHGYADSDWVGSSVDWKSTSGYCFSLGSTMIYWSNTKQGSIAQSTTKVEYIAANDASREAVWLRKLLSRLFQERLEHWCTEYNKSRIYSSSQRTQSSMTSPSGLSWNITLSETGPERCHQTAVHSYWREDSRHSD